MSTIEELRAEGLDKLKAEERWDDVAMLAADEAERARAEVEKEEKAKARREHSAEPRSEAEAEEPADMNEKIRAAWRGGVTGEGRAV
jgi:hypothetical protein